MTHHKIGQVILGPRGDVLESQKLQWLQDFSGTELVPRKERKRMYDALEVSLLE